MKALIVGGGIAGPVAATFLRRIGIDVTICEARAGVASEEGGFLGVAPNGMNVLTELGLASAVRASGEVSRGFSFRDARGRDIAAIDGRDDEARYGAPLVIARRGDLHRILLDGARAAGARARFGARLESLDRSDPQVVVARFEDGREEVADFVIGCDGIRSRTRALVLPESPEPASLGMVDYGGYARGVDAPLEIGWNTMVFGGRAFFGAFRRADGEIWWFHNGGEAASASATDDLEARRASILALHEGDPSWIGDVVRATPEILGPWGVHDIATMPSWHRGRVCLIGDAAHATSPSAGQGASLAMEDAMILARCLRDEGDPERAFARLEQLRRRRVETIVRQSRRNGSPKTAPGPVGAWFRDRLLPFFLKLGTAAQREQYGYRIDWNETRAA